MNAGAILIVRLGAMGDILHTLPAATSLKLSFPDRPIHWIVQSVWTPLLRGNPNIDKLIAFDRAQLAGWHAARRELRQSSYAMAIDFQGLIKSAVVARLSGASCIVGFPRGELREGPAAILYNERHSSASVHRVDRALDLAASAGATTLTRESPLPPGVPEGDLPTGKFVLASPFAGWGSKQWPLSAFEQLGERLRRETGIPLVLNAAPGADLSGVSHAIPHFSSISGLIDATRRATAVVGVDSGPLHLAAALRKPGVAIYGPTDPAINGPYGGTLTILRSESAETTYKRDSAIAGSMLEIGLDRVWEALQRALER